MAKILDQAKNYEIAQFKRLQNAIFSLLDINAIRIIT